MNNYDNEIFDETIYIINMKMNELKLLQLENRHMIMKLKEDNNQIKKSIKCLSIIILVNFVGIVFCFGYIYF